MITDDRMRTNLKPDYYDIVPSYTPDEMEARLDRHPFHLATLLSVRNIRRSVGLQKCRDGIREFLGEPPSTQQCLLGEVLTYRGFNTNVVDGFLKVKRELFVPEPYRPYSYLDVSIPFTETTCLSNPTVVALMIERLRANRGDRILEIGIGSGYHACWIVESLGGECEFLGVEINPLFQAFGARVMKEAGYSNIRVQVGNEQYPLRRGEKFDCIYTATAFNEVPCHVKELLHPGGTFQGTRPVTRSEFESEVLTSWLRRTYATYADYRKSQWFQSYACLATYEKTDGELAERDVVYDVAFVPYRAVADTELQVTERRLIPELDI